MVIQLDSREKTHAIKRILETFDSENVKWFVSKLPVGDYISLDNPRLTVDRKQNLLEVVQNVCQGHDRFVRELKRANEYGIKLVVLIEHSHRIKRLEDVVHWKNPRLAISPLAVSGERLYKIMCSLRDKYGVEWQFCDKQHTGRRIIQILER